MSRAGSAEPRSEFALIHPSGATGIVLAGGRSSRFGSDKLAARYRGAPLLHHAVVRMAEVCGEVIVAIAPNGLEPLLPEGILARVIRDPLEERGPLVGLVGALAETSSELALVAAGDMPDLQVVVLRHLLRVASTSAADAVALFDAGALHPLPAVLRVERAREVAVDLLSREERSLRTLLDALGVVAIEERSWHALDPGRRTLFDVDAPEDLQL